MQLAALLLGLFVSLCWTGLASAATLTGTFNGDAFATSTNITAGPLAASLGHTAYISCPCLGTGGQTYSNAVTSLSSGPGGNVLKAGAASSTVTTTELATSASVTNTARIDNINLLNGLITADAILAVANTTINNSQISSSPEGSTFVNLRIAGQAIGADVSINATIDLPGIGSVVLKKVTPSGDGTTTGSILVEMITINVTLANSLNLPVGSQIVVAHARSGFAFSSLRTVVSGNAFISSVKAGIGSLLNLGRGLTALVTLPCQGTKGQVLTNTIASVSLDAILSLGTGNTTAVGSVFFNSANAKTTARVQNVNLLNGLIRASALTSVAQTTLAGGVRTRSTNGTGFVGLRVLGLPLPVDIAPNSKIDLPLIGYVILNEQIIPPASSTADLQVNGIHIFVTTSNSLGLPVGTEVIVAHAATAAQNY